jgi:hypothetical protein
MKDRSNAIPLEIPMALYTEVEKNPKTCVEPQRTPNSQSNLEQKEQSRSITLPENKDLGMSAQDNMQLLKSTDFLNIRQGSLY